MSKYDESEVLKRLRDPKQKSKAFEDIVNHYSRTLYWQIRHIVVDHDDTDDVLQNTFLKAWNSLDNFKGDSQILTWLYRIAYNESITLIKSRRQAISIDVSTDDEGVQSPALQLESDKWIDGDKTQMMLQEALSKLPAKQKSVFTMKYFNSMKYEEISSITGTSVGALKASYHIAVEKITQFFNYYEC